MRGKNKVNPERALRLEKTGTSEARRVTGGSNPRNCYAAAVSGRECRDLFHWK